jgi:hypothetical protein
MRRHTPDGQAWDRARPALRRHVNMMTDPADGGLLGLPAYLLVHAAIRNVGNEPSGELRRHVMLAGKGNVTAAAAALRALCEVRPTAIEVLDGMMSWEEGDNETTSKNGLGIERTLPLSPTIAHPC